ECRRGVREFMPLTVMNIQVGSFDSFRQTHGNQAANQCLQHVAKALKKAVSRPGDLIALYDAGRFMLLLPSTNEMASSLAERCLETIRSTALSTPDTQQMSVALGIATMEPSTDLTPENVLKLADLALRDAQAKGGDKYVAVVANEKPNDTSYII
ncbi:MAG: GGDEF domain-containing protein, partial [Pontibacterium sp.]